jgi:hypothetical protein
MARWTRTRQSFKWLFTVTSALLLAAWILSAWRQVYYSGPYWAIRLQAGRIEFEHLSDVQGPNGSIKIPRPTRRRVDWAPYPRVSVAFRYGLRGPQYFRRAEPWPVPRDVGLLLGADPRDANPPTAPAYRSYLAIPLWLPLAITAPLGVVFWRLDRCVPPGHCPKCGYDLTGNVSGKCPECGMLTQHAAEQV